MLWGDRGMRKKKLIAITMLGILMMTMMSACAGTADNGDKDGASCMAVVMGCDWGPVVTKAVIAVPGALDKTQTISADMFDVSEKIKNGSFKSTDKREVTDAYFSDGNGNRLDSGTDGRIGHVTLEMRCFPDKNSLLFDDDSQIASKWVKKYELTVKMQKGKQLLLEDKKKVSPSVTAGFENEPDREVFVFPEVEKTDTKGVFTGKEGNKLTYASYAPSNASESNRRPLVIWLHGAGERGTDPMITIYGNKVVALMGDEFQTIMDGAYILAPQTTLFWKVNENGKYMDNENPGDHSLYLHDLKELIDQYVDSNYIDKDRIIVGGCSNGGFMTLDLLIHYPDYFAAAYPICEIYEPELISDEELKAIKDIPMWFVYAKNDQTVVPSKYEEPLLGRLKAADAKEIRVSVFEDVHDTTVNADGSGSPYQYLGHFSWIYFFNNECRDGGQTLWNWMSEQKK